MNLITRLKNNRSRWRITDRMLFSLFMTESLIEASQVGAGFIDGLVISRFLGSQAMAAEGIAHPIYSVLGIVSGLLAAGMQLRCSEEIGRGNRQGLSRYFSVTVYTGLILTSITMALILFFTEPFAVMLGASGNAAELAKPAASYLFGIGIGAPPLIMKAILAPAIQLDNGRKAVRVGALIEGASNVAMDLLAVKLGMGLFGVGLATSIGAYLNLLYLCTHFLKKDRMLHFVKPKITAKDYFRLLAGGNEKAVRRLSHIMRPVVLNAVIIAYGGTAAMSALSVRNNLSNFASIFASGIAAAISMLVGIYFGEVNEEAIAEINSYGHRLTALFCGSFGLLLIIFARPVASIYITEGGQVLDYVTFAFRMLGVQIPLQALLMSRVKYLQATHHPGLTNMLVVLSEVVFVILSALVLGGLFGVYGILSCFAAGDALSLLSVLVYCQFRCRKFFITRKDLLNLPASFHYHPGDVISLDVRNEEDVALCSEQIMLFGRGHAIDRKIAYYTALSFEELAADTIKNGFPKKQSGTPLIDLRVVVSEDAFVIRMRDNCPKYDVTKQIAAANEGELERTEDLGIRVVSRVASDVRYLQTFEMNSLILRFDLHPKTN